MKYQRMGNTHTWIDITKEKYDKWLGMKRIVPDDHKEEFDDEDYFKQCSDCDGHDACRDFGCAFKHGLGDMVQTDI